MRFRYSLLLILILYEPQVVYVESDDKHHISFPDHVIPCARLLSHIDSKSDSVIFSVFILDRKRQTEGQTHRIDIVSVQFIICLIIIKTGSIGTSSEIIPYVIPVRNHFESCPE